MRWTTGCTFLALAAMALPLWAQQPPASKPADKAAKDAAKLEEMKKKVDAALPLKAQVAPERPRKLLVMSATRGFRHSSIAIGAYAVVEMGRKTGAYEATHTEDAAFFEPDKLKEFDAVLMLNTTGDLFAAPKGQENAPEMKERSERLRKAFLEYVGSGKGIAGVHAATDCFYNWADYGALIGGYFNGHPWHEKIVVRNVEPDHPVNAVFEKKGFQIADEIYQIKDPYSRLKQRELLALESSEKDPELKKGKRPDKDYPIAWVKTHGEGRVFYCSLGHREEIYWNPAILQYYLAGIQFAMGDLKADASPSQKASIDRASAEEVLALISPPPHEHR